MILISPIFILYSFVAFVHADCLKNCINGDCQDNYCVCNQNYIGYDCSINAHALVKGDPLTINQNGTYYIQHIFAETHTTSQELYFKYDNQKICRAKVLISKLRPLTFEYYVPFSLSSDNSFSIIVSPEVQVIGHQLLIKIISSQNSDLTILFGNQEENSITSDDDISILVIILPIVSIVIIVILFLICYRKIRRIWKQRYSKRNIPPQPRQNPVYLEQRYLPPQQIVDQQQVPLYNPNEECSVCLQPLLNMPAVITPCQHKFHGNCILEVLMRQQACPNCRAYLLSNQLIGIAQPNQIQVQVI